MTNNQQTAAILIIGNEILSGRTQDKNVQFIAGRLSELGVVLSEVRIVPDEKEQIINAVNKLRKKYSYLFTTGGIGPTHDDITAASIAEAFGVQLVRDEALAIRLKKRCNLSDDDVIAADIPQGAKLIEVDSGPGFNIENVYVLAGIPSIARAMFEKLESELVGGKKFSSRIITVLIGESTIKNVLSNVQNDFSDLQLGSYPFVREDGSWGTDIVIRGQDGARIAFAATKFLQELDKMNIKYSEELE